MGIEGGETVSLLAYVDASLGVQPDMIGPIFESTVLSVFWVCRTLRYRVGVTKSGLFPQIISKIPGLGSQIQGFDIDAQTSIELI